jgi:NTP pyrophosphatase (non-canonical NTP hydrolase)
MTSYEYQCEAARSEPSPADYCQVYNRLLYIRSQKILHSIIGINTESGELSDIVKKYIFYGKDFDIANFKEELGDLLWYIAIGANACDTTIKQLMEENIDKLKKRYPSKFTEKDALERKDKI